MEAQRSRGALGGTQTHNLRAVGADARAAERPPPDHVQEAEPKVGNKAVSGSS